MATDLNTLVGKIRACTVCAAELPCKPRPIVVLRPKARVLIIGQAPGTKVQETGIPWNDPSGDRLRSWLGLERDTFYNHLGLAIMPMGFCYPGKIPKGGDAPPRKECAPLWHDSARELMPEIQLTLLVGSYAQKYYLGSAAKRTLHETVLNWAEYLPEYLPTPHPSWRVNAWLSKNLWYENELVPDLQTRVHGLLQL